MLNNIFSKIPTDLKDEVFEEIIKSNSIKIERIISKGHSTPKSQWYNQDRDEWVILLKGKARLEFENNHYEELVEGDYINIPKHKLHRVSWTIPNQETIWLAIHY